MYTKSRVSGSLLLCKCFNLKPLNTYILRHFLILSHLNDDYFLAFKNWNFSNLLVELGYKNLIFFALCQKLSQPDRPTYQRKGLQEGLTLQ